jgi:hypothetical protein
MALFREERQEERKEGRDLSVTIIQFGHLLSIVCPGGKLWA